MTGTRSYYLIFTLGLVLLLVVCFSFYMIGFREAQEQSYFEQKACSDTLEQVKLSQKELESRYQSSLEALNISNQYSENQTSLIIGRSYGDKFYFVLTDGYNSSQIADIENHELCHQLVVRDEKHFC